MRFKSLVLLGVLWTLVVYCPIAHIARGEGGWLAQIGLVSFAWACLPARK